MDKGELEKQEFVRWSVGGLCLYAAYITITCPCQRVLSCHLPHIYGSLGAALAITLINNPP
jgi:hypothetical protein